jgi:hypothetical protein
MLFIHILNQTFIKNYKKKVPTLMCYINKFKKYIKIYKKPTSVYNFLSVYESDLGNYKNYEIISYIV